MDLETRQQIIAKVKSCPYEKCRSGIAREDYESYQIGVVGLIENMNHDHLIAIQKEDGTVEVGQININQVLAIFDPIEIDDE